MGNFELELRGGMEWMVRRDEGQAVEGYIADKDTGERIAEVLRGEDGLFIGKIGHEAVAGPTECFNEVVDRLYVEVQCRVELRDRYAWHQLAGTEGIYKLGEAGGKVYVANAFWSDNEPGCINIATFEVDLAAEEMECLDAGCWNGYLTIGKCVRQEALVAVPLESVSPEHICSCNWKIESFEDLLEALDEHDLGPEALGEGSYGEIADLKREVIDFANARTNGAFAEHMSYEKAVQCLDEPGLGLPPAIEETVERIEELKEAASRGSKGLDAQIAEARATSDARADKDHEKKPTQGMEDPSL